MNTVMNDPLGLINNLDTNIHTPARLMIIKALSSVSSIDCVELVKQTKLTWGNLSTHLVKLENSGYVYLTKTYNGKKPTTIVSLTALGNNAYLEWGRTILQALPVQISRILINDIKQKAVPDNFKWRNVSETDADKHISLLRESIGTGNFFLPSYHRWIEGIPPKESMNSVM